MPYRGSRKVTMKIEKIMSMIARKKEELKLLEEELLCSLRLDELELNEE